MPGIVEIPNEIWNLAKSREREIRELAESNATRSQIKEVAESIGISVSWTYKLIKRWKSDPSISSILPQKKGNKLGSHRLDLECNNIIDAAIEGYYSTLQKPSKWWQAPSIVDT